MEASDVAKGVTIVHSKQRPQIIDEVEKLLSIWTKEIFGMATVLVKAKFVGRLCVSKLIS